MEKQKILHSAISILMILLIVGCVDENKVTGGVTVKLESNTISNGETTTIELGGVNTGKVAADVILNVVVEDPKKLIVSYPGSLGDVLQPKENIGTKRVNIQGFTDYSSTTYWVKAQLINKATNEILDEKMVWITVKK